MNIMRRSFRYRFFNATMFLVGANILVFAAQNLLGYPSLTSLLALNPLNVLRGGIWQFATYMFAHGSLSHLVFNMLALFLFGYQVEREMGSVEFLLYYFLCGILAGAASFAVYLVTHSYYVFLIGASGAVFAVQLAFAIARPNALVFLMGFIPLRAPVMVLGATAVELFSTVAGSRDGVAHLTHLFGFAFGWLYFLVRFGINPWRYLWKRRIP